MTLTQSVRLLYISAITSSGFAMAEVPNGYYDSVNTASSAQLKSSLHEIIDDHKRFPYTSSATDTWDILEQADQDPNNANNVIDIYKNASYTKAGGGNSFYNREHSWPKSYGFPKDGASNYPYTDAHHLFIANSSYNSSRSNKPYANCDANCSEKPTEYNDFRGGGAGESNLTVGSGATGSWQTWNSRRGDVARALMYLAVRYEGGNHSITGASEPDLRLTDDRNLIANSNTRANISVAYMGLKSVLLQWHKEDPVDSYEQRHNDAVYQHQGNRNPFIDHPEYVSCVFENQCNNAAEVSVWFNEIHYDNNGGDTNELIELAGSANTDLSGWSLVAYNGTNGQSYKTITLNGTIPNQLNQLGTIAFNFSGLQNGGSDGVALVNDKNEVVQFISYEGTVTATNGPAQGQTSTDIGVRESNSTQLGYSLQLTGSGREYNDFTWQAPRQSSPGHINNNQGFTAK